MPWCCLDKHTSVGCAQELVRFRDEESSASGHTKTVVLCRISNKYLVLMETTIEATERHYEQQGVK